jgi:hypothetical protein
VANALTRAGCEVRWTLLARGEMERVRFDIQALQNPKNTGAAYQRGTLFVWELRAYVLARFGWRCAWCGQQQVPLDLEPIRPKSRVGSDRVANLALSCHPRNQGKGHQTVSLFGHSEVERQAQAPLRDAAAFNAARHRQENCTQWACRSEPGAAGPRWNRDRFGLQKSPALDAPLGGNLAGSIGGSCGSWWSGPAAGAALTGPMCVTRAFHVALSLFRNTCVAWPPEIWSRPWCLRR